MDFITQPITTTPFVSTTDAAQQWVNEEWACFKDQYCRACDAYPCDNLSLGKLHRCHPLLDAWAQHFNSICED